MSNAQDDRETPRRSSGFNIGWLIFMLLIFGRPLWGWLEPRVRALFAPGGTGAAPSLDWLPWAVGAGVALFVLVAVVRAAAGAGQQHNPSLPAPTQLPTSRPSPPPSRPFPPSSPPSPSGLPTPPLPPASPQQLGGPPRFEPIIEPNVLLGGIVVMVGLGLLLVLFAPSLLGL
jgi:hypothetical protein